MSTNGQRPYHHGDLRRSLMKLKEWPVVITVIRKNSLWLHRCSISFSGSGIHGLAQLISGGYLTRLAATEGQVETLGKMACELLLTGILKPGDKREGNEIQGGQ